VAVSGREAICEELRCVAEVMKTQVLVMKGRTMAVSGGAKALSGGVVSYNGLELNCCDKQRRSDVKWCPGTTSQSLTLAVYRQAPTGKGRALNTYEWTGFGKEKSRLAEQSIGKEMYRHSRFWQNREELR